MHRQVPWTQYLTMPVMKMAAEVPVITGRQEGFLFPGAAVYPLRDGEARS